MDILESTNEYLQPFINLKGLLDQKVNQQSKTDFITFVRMMAPMLVSDWRMGRHIEVISDKLKDLENGTIKRLMVSVLNCFLLGILEETLNMRY